MPCFSFVCTLWTVSVLEQKPHKGGDFDSGVPPAPEEGPAHSKHSINTVE